VVKVKRKIVGLVNSYSGNLRDSVIKTVRSGRDFTGAAVNVLRRIESQNADLLAVILQVHRTRSRCRQRYCWSIWNVTARRVGRWLVSVLY
jgi:hypothetical protein